MAMIDPTRLREQLDACRPSHDDLSWPEMAEARAELLADESARQAFANQQRQDRAIAKAWRDVEVPVGLEDRILAAISQAAIPQAAIPQAAIPQAAIPQAAAGDANDSGREKVALAEPAVVGRTPRRSRRWVMLLVASAASLLIVGAVWWRRPQPLHLAGLSELSRAVADEAAAWDRADWRAFDANDFPSLRWRPARWRKTHTTIDGRTDVFEFPLRDGSRLFLLQFHVDNTLDLPTIPYQSLGGTGPWKVGAWYEAGILNVAVTNHGSALDAFRTPFRPT